MMNEYQKELQVLRPNDEIQNISYFNVPARISDYQFINTAGHGYLVIPNDDINYQLAKSIVNYGYIGKNAIYLEEDNELPEFIDSKKLIIKK